MKNIVIFLAALLPLLAGAQTGAAPQAPFGGGEELAYTVSYRAALIPEINMMHITMRTLAEDQGGHPYYHVIGNGRSSKFAKSFFDLNDTYHTWLDAKTLLPSRMTSDLREDNYRFTATYNYDWRAMEVNTVFRNARWDADRRASMRLLPESGDALSLLYRLRATDAAGLEKGKSYPLDLVLNDTTKTISYRFLGREEIKIKKIGTFRAMKFTCTMATGDGSTYEDGMEFTVWMSDDANKIPLLIESPIRVGSVRVMLSEASNLLNPMSSRVD